MLQSCYVHPGYRGQGYGLSRTDLEGLRRRFVADVVVLTLLDDGLVSYWHRRGFDVVQRAEVIDVCSYLSARCTRSVPCSTTRRSPPSSPRTSPTARSSPSTRWGDGALLLLRRPGDGVVEELIVGSPGALLRCRPVPDVAIRLKTVMAGPGDLDLVCAIDL